MSHWLRLLGIALLAWIALGVALVLPLRFAAPATTAFMLASDIKPVHYEWIPWKKIAPTAELAVIASEDQKFPEHRGFDFEAMDAALEHNEHSRRIRGGSTISQQTAKNLFLWRGRSYLRKGLEAWFTVLLEGICSKQRILEIYLNVVQFGPDTYGVEAASRRYFGKPAASLSAHEAALLAAVLPNPVRFHVDRPSGYVDRRTAEIEEQMRLLGPGYLLAVH